MTTATAKEQQAFSAHEIKIGKTTYQIINIEVASSESVFNVILQNKNTTKELSLVSGDWFLSSGRRGLPKFVTPTFLQHEVICELNA